MSGIIPNFKKKGPNTVGQRTNEDLWTRTGTFINKPVHGWLHPEDKLKAGGICYGVRYVGCLEVKQSTRTLPFEVRGLVTKEAIFRVCDAAGFSYTRKKKANKSIVKILGDVPNVQFRGANVNLTISTSSINLTVMQTGKCVIYQHIKSAAPNHLIRSRRNFKEVIANHQMQGISFASGGDHETPDYVAYVAKDPVNLRACHVLECLGGLAQDVITTIGQAFEIRFKDYLKNPPQAFNAPDKFAEPIFGDGESAWGEDPEYYNDISRLDANGHGPQGAVAPDPSPPALPAGQYMQVNGALPPNPYASLKTTQSSPTSVSQDSPSHHRSSPTPYDSRSGIPMNRNPPLPSAPLIDLNGSSGSPPVVGYHAQQNSGDARPSERGSPVPLPRRSHSRQSGENSSLNPPSGSDSSIPSTSPEVCKRKTPTLYDTARQVSPTPSQQSAPAQQSYQNIEESDVGHVVKDEGYDNFRALQERQKLNRPKATPSTNSAAESTMFNSPSVLAPGYDNPPQAPHHRQVPSSDSMMEEGVYNAHAHSFRSPSMPGGQNGSHRTDVFDMEPFNPSGGQRHPLGEEEWYHGPMTRREGEALLEEDGDFLVRESTSSKGQYVLSGMQNGQPKHLLLVDPQGKVRTKDKEFDSVSHLIKYHRTHNLPIISAGSAVYLKHPVLNARAAGKMNH